MPDKKQAWDDLHRLTSDNSGVRRDAAFAHVPDKEQTCADLYRLTSDDDSNVRIAANHSSGRVSIFRASEAESDDVFKREIENAIGFFENHQKKRLILILQHFAFHFTALFLLSLSRKKKLRLRCKNIFQRAKSAVAGSESKEKLLEAVENLGNALLYTTFC